MFTLIDTHSPAVIETRSMFGGTAVRACDQDLAHAGNGDITLAEGSAR